MRAIGVTFLLVILSNTGFGEELTDTDVEMIIELADGVWKGQVIYIQEIDGHISNGEILPYRNAKVQVSTLDGSIRSFRASKIDGDWRLDDEAIKRLEYQRKSISKYRESQNE